jgi:Tol biopolymer transport system component
MLRPILGIIVITFVLGVGSGRSSDVYQPGDLSRVIAEEVKESKVPAKGIRPRDAGWEASKKDKGKSSTQKAKSATDESQSSESETTVKSKGLYQRPVKPSKAESPDVDKTGAEDSTAEGLPQSSEKAGPDGNVPSAVIPDSTEAEKKPAATESVESLTTDQPAKPSASDADRHKMIQPLFVQAFTDINPGHNDSNPIWSPTGRLIAFERSIGDKREIIVARADGAVLQKIYCRLSDGDDDMQLFLPGIIEDVSYNAGLSWSPSEKSIVFMSNGGSGNYDLYLLPALGEESTIRLTDHTEKDSHPHWSPVADRLVFVSGRSGKAEIYLMDLVTGKVNQLTQGKKTYLYPQWSPDGKKIVMIYGSNENHDIYLIEDINRPTETLRPLTTWRYDDLRPVWSPDGTKIAFYSNYNLENNPKLWSLIVISADGSDADSGENLVEKIIAVDVIPDIEGGPAWMLDSKRIVYVKNDEQSYNPIYVVDIENNTNFPINTGTKMNHDVVCTINGTIAFRAQVEQWDHIYIARLEE